MEGTEHSLKQQQNKSGCGSLCHVNWMWHTATDSAFRQELPFLRMGGVKSGALRETTGEVKGTWSLELCN